MSWTGGQKCTPMALYKCKLRLIQEHLTACLAGNVNDVAAQPEDELSSFRLVGGSLPQIPEFCVNTDAVA